MAKLARHVAVREACLKVSGRLGHIVQGPTSPTSGFMLFSPKRQVG